MHPAFSVIFFTVSSGTGYGLLFLLGLLAGLDKLPESPVLGLVGMALGLGLVVAGLLSSLFHLGHPERAWRAFSQWKTSWLSREGVVSVASFGPSLGLAYLWVFHGPDHPLLALSGWATAALAVVTVYCTAMIYRSLRPVHQWANGWTVPAYLAMGLAGGGLLLVVLYALFGLALATLPLCAAAALMLAWAVKTGYWHFVDTSKSASTAETATGLGHIGKVRQLEGPHTEDNYLLKEMGFRVAQKHSQKLRRYAHVLGFLIPVLLLVAAAQSTDVNVALVAVCAVIFFMIGAITERWLFFAEARHTVTLYYGG
ncbi:MAG: dimethyl sulfoxide reductase anchor subunit [Rhodospirillales bacterium]|nr:dimethyl sulfoxide reductase anchor subunit [Rhodospirillales bacterium]